MLADPVDPARGGSAQGDRLGATPVAVFAGLEAVGHVAPYHEAAPPLTHLLQTGGWWPAFWLFVASLAVGVLIRKVLASGRATRSAWTP